MEEFTREDLRKLVARQEEPCVSIYIPLHMDMPEALHNPVPFKKLLSDAEREMLAAGHSASRVSKVVQPGRELLADYGFWQQRSPGLAAFLSPYGFYRFRLPIPFTEKVVVADRFHTKPLLPLLHSDGQYYILALSQNEVRFLQATRRGVRRLDLKGIPANMDDALQYEKLERQMQLHTYDSPSSRQEGNRTAIFHAQGAPQDAKKEDVARFIEILARRVGERLSQENLPLVLVAVEYLQPMFRQHNGYAHVVQEGVHGNPEVLSDDELREQTWPKVEPVFTAARGEAMKRLDDLKASAVAAIEPNKVIPAAFYGSIDTLFMDINSELWGRFDADEYTLTLHPERQNGDEDLMDAAVTQTVLHSGTVFAATKEELPGQTSMAALLRYPL